MLRFTSSACDHLNQQPSKGLIWCRGQGVHPKGFIVFVFILIFFSSFIFRLRIIYLLGYLPIQLRMPGAGANRGPLWPRLVVLSRCFICICTWINLKLESSSFTSWATAARDGLTWKTNCDLGLVGVVQHWKQEGLKQKIDFERERGRERHHMCLM